MIASVVTARVAIHIVQMVAMSATCANGVIVALHIATATVHAAANAANYGQGYTHTSVTSAPATAAKRVTNSKMSVNAMTGHITLANLTRMRSMTAWTQLGQGHS